MDTAHSIPRGSEEPATPLRLRFDKDTHDDAGNALGWRPTADALLMADGTVAVIPVQSRGCREAAVLTDVLLYTTSAGRGRAGDAAVSPVRPGGDRLPLAAAGELAGEGDGPASRLSSPSLLSQDLLPAPASGEGKNPTPSTSGHRESGQHGATSDVARRDARPSLTVGGLAQGDDSNTARGAACPLLSSPIDLTAKPYGSDELAILAGLQAFVCVSLFMLAIGAKAIRDELRDRGECL